MADRFKLNELRDASPPAPITTRVARWSESTEDISALRRLASDGPLSIGPGSRGLLAASLSVARVINDKSGSVRMVKSSDNCARDDVVASLLLCAGRWQQDHLLDQISPCICFCCRRWRRGSCRNVRKNQPKMVFF